MRDQCLRLMLTRGGRRIAMVERAPEFRDDLELQSVTYQPTVVLTGLKTLSYCANMTATRIAHEPRRRARRCWSLPAER